MKRGATKLAYLVVAVFFMLGVAVFSYQDSHAQTQDANDNGTRCARLAQSRSARHSKRHRNNSNMNANTGGNMNTNNGNGNSPSR